LFLFTRFVIALRKAHPCLRVDRFGDFAMDTGNDVTHWFKAPDGNADIADGDQRIHWRIDGSGIGDVDFLLLINMGADAADFPIPAPSAGKRWLRIVDTAAWAEAEGNFWTPSRAQEISGNYGVNPRSLAILQEGI
jgi:glycogen operon protein